MSSVFDVVMIPLQLVIVFFTIYYFVISWFGLFGKMRQVKEYPEQKTFALIVCAHNEHAVIAQLVENLRKLNYSHKLYDIFWYIQSLAVYKASQDVNTQLLVRTLQLCYQSTGKASDKALVHAFQVDWRTV